MPLDADIARSQASSRSAGAVGSVARPPLAYRVAQEFIQPHHTVLDFGSGKHAVHTATMRQAGHNVTAHDYTVTPGIHDPDALKRRYHVVVASNVLNVQNSPRQLARTLNDLANSVDPAGGMAIANFPMQPRYDAFAGLTPVDAVTKLEDSLKRRFKEVTRHPMGGNRDPIWILKGPKFHAPHQGVAP